MVLNLAALVTRPMLIGLGASTLVLGVQSLRLDWSQRDLAKETTAHANDIKFWKQAGVLAITRSKLAAAATEKQYAEELSNVRNEVVAAGNRARTYWNELRAKAGINQRGPGEITISLDTAASPGTRTAPECEAAYIDLAEAAELDSIQIVGLQKAYNAVREANNSITVKLNEDGQ